MKYLKKLLLGVVASFCISPVFAQTFKVPNLQVLGTTTFTNPLTGANGGTGVASIPQYSIAVGGANNIFGFISPGVAGTLLASNGASATPSYQTLSTLGIANSGANSSITSLTGLTTPLNTASGGLGANNSSATGVPIFSSGAVTVTSTTGTGSVVLQNNGTLNTPTISGVTSGSCATSGNLGECALPSATGITLTNSTAGNCTSVSLSAGDWLVFGTISYSPGTGASFSLLDASLSITSNTLDTGTGNFTQLAFTGTTNFGQAINAPTRLFTISSPTTVFLVGEAGFSGGTATMSCKISAIRFH